MNGVTRKCARASISFNFTVLQVHLLNQNQIKRKLFAKLAALYYTNVNRMLVFPKLRIYRKTKNKPWLKFWSY